MVASSSLFGSVCCVLHVSIPFIAGQWSLPPHGGGIPAARCGVSIPFIAGQWSLQYAYAIPTDDQPEFQSPSLRGSGRFSKAPRTRRRCGRRVSIPFIAGQWSLLSASGTSWGVNPSCFNPLHCGAVVASYFIMVERLLETHVSIPFIAGQWSLLL